MIPTYFRSNAVDVGGDVMMTESISLSKISKFSIGNVAATQCVDLCRSLEPYCFSNHINDDSFREPCFWTRSRDSCNVQFIEKGEDVFFVNVEECIAHVGAFMLVRNYLSSPSNAWNGSNWQAARISERSIAKYA